MKKRLIAVLCICAMLLAGCAPVTETAEEQKQVYASFFPIYALSGLVLQDIPEIDVKCFIQPQDDCLRLYDLSDWDASVLAYDADVVIIGGRGLEAFESALYTFGEGGPAVINSMYGLRLHNDDGSSILDGNTGHLADANPYLYMSVPGARQMINVIAPAMAMLYPEYAEKIAGGLQRTDKELEKLYTENTALCADIKGEKVILMNEALIYVAEDYGLEVVYRYDRESGTTLYGEGLTAAINDLRNLDADVILIEKQAPAELTKALEAEGFTVVKIDIMNSYPANAGPEHYYEVQRNNAAALADAFGGR